LEKVNAVDVLADGQVVAGQDADSPEDSVAAAAKAEDSRQQMEESRVAMMRGYAETRGCRRQYVLNYFGEAYDDPCLTCDNCQAGHTLEEDKTEQPFPLNSRVHHDVWGQGLVVRYEGNEKVVVLFDEMGYKTLSVPAVLDGGLLSLVNQ
jgi:ATP-dependent DNA helicase RecQ